MATYGEVIGELKEPTRSLSKRIPETWHGFAEAEQYDEGDDRRWPARGLQPSGRAGQQPRQQGHEAERQKADP
jgi:hypothetical protein